MCVWEVLVIRYFCVSKGSALYKAFTDTPIQWSGNLASSVVNHAIEASQKSYFVISPTLFQADEKNDDDVAIEADVVSVVVVVGDFSTFSSATFSDDSSFTMLFDSSSFGDVLLLDP